MGSENEGGNANFFHGKLENKLWPKITLIFLLVLAILPRIRRYKIHLEISTHKGK